MKKILLLTTFSFLLSLGLFAQDVVEEQRSLLTKITATWCPNCGTWGWTFFEDIIVDNSDKSVLIGAHHSGDLGTAIALAITENFDAPYQPYFYNGNTDLNVSNTNLAAKRQEVKTLVDAKFLESPIANSGFTAILDGDILNIEAKAKFFQEATGDFYLGVYLLENGVINQQASNVMNASHPFVMRQAITDSDFGFALANGTIAADTEFTESLSTVLSPDWIKDNLSIIGIIWEKVGDKYEFVNVFSTNEFEDTPNAVQTIAADLLKVDLAPTIAQEYSQLNLNLNSESLAVNIQIINVNGQIVQEVFEGKLLTGSTSFTLETNRLDAGIYFVNIQANDGAVLTKRLVVR